MAFDKTGTLTAGRPRLTDVVGLENGLDETEVLRLAAAVESGSNHPLAHAIVEEARAQQLSCPASSDAGALPGQAARATVEGRALSVASPRHAASLGITSGRGCNAPSTPSRRRATPPWCCSTAARALGLLALRDEPRPEAQAALAELRGHGHPPADADRRQCPHRPAIAADLGLSASRCRPSCCRKTS